MKIVFLADCITTQKAGIHYYARNLVDQIIKSYPEHDYYLVASEKIEDLQISQIIVPINEFIPFHLRWRQVFIIPKEVGKVNPDYVIELAHFGPFNLRSAIDRVTVIHDLTPITHPRWHPFISSITHKLILPYVVKRAKYIITNSSWTKAQIKRYYQKNDQDVLVSYPRLKDL